MPPSALADEDESQLPKTSVPIRYDLILTTAVETGDLIFRGFENIEIEVTQETNTITLHSRGISVKSVRLYNKAGYLLESKFNLDAAKDFLVIESTGRPLTAQEIVKVEVEFSSLLRQGTSGFYRSSYREGNTKK